MKISLFILFFLCTSVLYSDPSIDSLKTALKLANEKDKSKIYSKISQYFWYKDSLESAENANLAFKYAYQSGDDKSIADAHLTKGVVFELHGSKDSAISYYNKGLNLFIQCQDRPGIASSYRNLGDIIYSKSKYSEALKYYIKSEKIYLDLISDSNDDYDLNNKYGALLNNIGNIYKVLSDYESALKYSKKAIIVQEKLNDSASVASAWINIGTIYYHWQKLEKAVAATKRSIKYVNKTKSPFLFVSLNANLCSYYTLLKKYADAKHHISMSIDHAKESMDPELSRFAYAQLIKFYSDTKQTQKMRELLPTLKKIFIAHKDMDWLVDVYGFLYKMYKEENILDEAIASLEARDALRDSIFKLDTQTLQQEMVAKYDTEKKQIQIENQQSEIESRNTIILVIIAAFILISIFVILLFKVYKEKIKNHNIILEQNKEIKQSHEELEVKSDLIQDQNKKLRELNNMKDKFFSIISHDMRNPITSLNLLTDLIEISAEKKDYNNILKKSKKFKTSLKVLFEFFDNLLKWSRTQNEGCHCKPETFKVEKIVDNVLELLELNAENKKITLSKSVHSDIEIYADSNMLETIIRNITSNALKFTDKDGFVRIEIKQDDEYTHFLISDTGLGMNNEEISNLFRIDKMNKKYGTARESGTGLGLIISKEFLDMHKAIIDIQSKPNEGTQFNFSIPR